MVIKQRRRGVLPKAVAQNKRTRQDMGPGQNIKRKRKGKK